MNKYFDIKGIVVFFCILAFFACNQKNANNTNESIKVEEENEYQQNSDNEIDNIAYSSETETELFFNYIDYCNWYEEYETEETDKRPYGYLSFDDNPELMQNYLKVYNDSIIKNYTIFNLNKSFDIYMLLYNAHSRAKLITVSNNQIIDRISIGNQDDNYEWKELSFTISKELDVIIYKNKLRDNKIVEQNKIEQYKIDNAGNFHINMEANYFFISLLLSFSSYNFQNKTQLELLNINDKTSINWHVIPCGKLPYKILIPDSYQESWLYDLEEFYIYLDGQYDEHKELNLLFNNSTELNHKPWDYFPANTTAGHFFKRLPDVNNNKILLFAVFDSNINYELGEKSVWLELQTFSEKNEIIDKMIVFMTVANECSFGRSFVYNSNNIFELRDRVMCYDTDENVTLLSDTTSNYFYQITENGKIEQKQ